MRQGFKQIPGLEYYAVNKNGDVLSIRNDKILKQATNGPKGDKRYQVVCIYQKVYYVHRLVAMTWIPNPKGLVEINHKDLNKQNNSVKNLEWTTRKDNVNHYFKNRKTK